MRPAFLLFTFRRTHWRIKRGRAGSAPPPGRRTDAVAVLLISDSCKTCTSEFSKWLPPVAISQLYSAPNSFTAWAPPWSRWWPQTRSWFKGGPTSKRKGRGGAQLPLTQISGSAPDTDCRCDARNSTAARQSRHQTPSTLHGSVHSPPHFTSEFARLI